MYRTSQSSDDDVRAGGSRPPSTRRRRGDSHNIAGTSACHFLDLPDDVFFVIFRFFSPATLCRVAQVCPRLRLLASKDSVWLPFEKERPLLRANNSRCVYSLKERYRVALNWEAGHRQQSWLLKHKKKLLPWIQRDESHALWVSRGSNIHKFEPKPSGRLRESDGEPLQGLSADVTRFVINNGILVSGCRDGRVSTWEASSGVQLLNSVVHQSDAQCVDVSDVIVSGSKDKTVKVLSMVPEDKERVLKSFNVGDRVWSLSISPNKSTVAVGTACFNYPAICLLDIQRGELVRHLGEEHKRGFGVLDVKFESPSILLTCGHDSYLRMWDLRTHTCVNTWFDPYDSTLYCLQTDGDCTMLTGTARHGLVRLWDKRMTDSVQEYFSRDQHSPVYSLAGSSHHLYIALDMGLYFADFSIR